MTTGKTSRMYGSSDCSGWRVNPTDPSIIPERQHDSRHQVSLYGEASWDLSPLGGPPSSRNRVIHWARFPKQFEQTFRRAAWLLINSPTPTVMLDQPGTSAIEYYSAGSVRKYATHEWRDFAVWLQENGITKLRDVSRSDLERYASRVQRLESPRSSKLSLLRGVTLLWAHAPRLPASDVLVMPPWIDESISDFLPTGEGRSQNATAVIHPSTMAPLLFWAQRFLEFGPDIVAATKQWQSLVSELPAQRSESSLVAAESLVAGWAQQGITTLPATILHKRQIAFKYIAASNGVKVHPDDLNLALRRSGFSFKADAAQPTPIDCPITATLNGHPWCDQVNYRDLVALRHALLAAGLVVVTYLTGIRPSEALALEPGCCTRKRISATTLQYSIVGRKFKRVQKAGKSDPDGEERTWVTIAPVATAINTLENLFPENSFLFPSSRDKTVPLTTSKASASISILIEMANKLCQRLNLPDAYAIPADPAGPISLGRFRRTLAWHIRRLPHGPIALAIQYGHLQVSQGAGYAGLEAAGFTALMDFEEAAAIKENIEQARRDLTEGQAASGPAAKRLVHLISHAVVFNGSYLSDKDLSRIKADTRLRVYENPQSYALCMFDPTRALCRTSRDTGQATEPKIVNCQPNCPNIARLDRHIEGLKHEADRLRKEAASPVTPAPLAARLQMRADACTAIIEDHRATAIQSPTEPDSEATT
jgi:hypothetical protein